MNKVSAHKEICNQLNKIYEAKNHDYGDSFGKGFKEYGYVMPVIRLEDKFNRLKSLTVNNKAPRVKEESIEDTLMDLANYAIMALIELREKQFEVEQVKEQSKPSNFKPYTVDDFVVCNLNGKKVCLLKDGLIKCK